ncbi:unnamed protein product [Paramecium octaurelia]|uniref:Uncharacterized protein n=1 Tax=Paramecium octaurelia TaxID=43137 RepID=A0A8S1WJM9_PAROT|nr:unnamed protein product [Paramecium octaurelia]
MPYQHTKKENNKENIHYQEVWFISEFFTQVKVESWFRRFSLKLIEKLTILNIFSYIQTVFFTFLFISVILIPILIKIGIWEKFRIMQCKIIEICQHLYFIWIHLNHTMLYFRILGVLIYRINDDWGVNILNYKSLGYLFVGQLLVIGICWMFLKQITFFSFHLLLPILCTECAEANLKRTIKLQNDPV